MTSGKNNFSDIRKELYGPIDFPCFWQNTPNFFPEHLRQRL